MCHNSCQTKLFENEISYVNWCENCQIYTLVYHTSCIAFTKSELVRFHKILSELEDDHFLPYHTDKDTVILKSTKGLMGINLMKEQVHELIEIFDQAMFMEQFYNLIDY